MRIPPETAQADDPFAGKILVVNERSNPNFGATLEEVHLRRLGDQQFLVGKGFASEEGKGWYNDRVVWVPLSDVSQLTEFQDRRESRSRPATIAARLASELWRANGAALIALACRNGRLSPAPARAFAPRDRASRH